MALQRGTRRKGSTRRWRRLRLFILNRDDWRCKFCRGRGRMEVDHIIPRRLGGSDDPANLRALCRSCHIARHAKKYTPSQIRWQELVEELSS